MIVPKSTRSLDDYRSEMQDRRVESVDRPGVHLDTSPSGAGKSHSDIAAAEKAGNSLIVVPTHKNSREVAAEFAAAGLLAEAYPELSKKTCANHDQAVAALGAGLSASGAVCPGCPFSDMCEYRESLVSADDAAHRVCTHHRARLSMDHLAEGRRYIAVHEDSTGLLRPAETIATGFQQVVEVADAASHAAWNRQQTSARYFFHRVATAANEIGEHLSNAATTTPIQLPTAASIPSGAHATLFHEMRELKIFPPAAAMKLCLAVAAGELSEMVVRVNKIFRRGGKSEVKQSIVGVWETKLPDGIPIVLSDATADRAELEFLLGRKVVDVTPAGHLTQWHQPIQVPHLDVKKSSKSATIVRILRALLVAFPEYSRVGILTHKKHVPSINGTARKEANLDRCFRDRIGKVGHFRSGSSRGSNDWLSECDVIFVLGTPRVPPAAVQTRLIQTGRPQAAARDGRWERDYWSGVDMDGHRHTVKTAGYRDHDWHQAHRSIVRAELLQAIGRGRGILEGGILAIVVSNEDLGLPLATIDVRPLPDVAVEVLQTMAELSPVFSKRNTLENAGLNWRQIAEVASKSKSRILEVLDDLRKRGLVEKIGQRGGWILSAPALKIWGPRAMAGEHAGEITGPFSVGDLTHDCTN